MPLAFHSSEPRFLFFWNHKVASRSLLKGLKDAFPRLRVYAQPAFRPPLDDARWPRFLVVRNPWARAVSCFRNKCRDAEDALARNGGLEPCQEHILGALGVRPVAATEGARILSGLSFASFVDLLPAVREGNSHFRLQTDLLRHAHPPDGVARWLLRGVGVLTHLARTHFRTPRFLKEGIRPEEDVELLARARTQRVRWIKLEELAERWPEVERELGRTIPLSWRARTGIGNDWQGEYDEELAEKVGRLYRVDVVMFRYGGDGPVSFSGF